MGFQRDTLLKLLEGVKRFEEDVYPENKDLFEHLATSQTPPTLFITCCDSRINPNLISQTEPGELFIIRNVGNMVPYYTAQSGAVVSGIEYAVSILKVKNIIVCGHSDCGAMHALTQINSPKIEKLPATKNWLRNAEAALAVTDATCNHDDHDFLRILTENNVRLQMAHLRSFPVVAGAIAAKKLSIEGWYYDIPTGKVSILSDKESENNLTIDEMIEKLRANEN